MAFDYRTHGSFQKRRSVHHVIGCYRSLYLFLRSGFSFLTSCPTVSSWMPLSPRITPFWRFFRTSIPSITSCSIPRKSTLGVSLGNSWCPWSGYVTVIGLRVRTPSEFYSCCVDDVFDCGRVEKEFHGNRQPPDSAAGLSSVSWTLSGFEAFAASERKSSFTDIYLMEFIMVLCWEYLVVHCSESVPGLFAVFSVPGRWTSSKRSRISLVREHMGLMSVRWTQQKSGDSCSEGNPDSGEI